MSSFGNLFSNISSMATSFVSSTSGPTISIMKIGTGGEVCLNGKIIPIPEGANSVSVINNKLFVNGKEYKGATGENRLQEEPKIIHLTINGTVGTVSTVSGDIHISKNATTVNNVSGDNIIAGDVYGSLHNVSGRNTCKQKAVPLPEAPVARKKKRKVVVEVSSSSSEAESQEDPSDSDKPKPKTRPLKKEKQTIPPESPPLILLGYEKPA